MLRIAPARQLKGPAPRRRALPSQSPLHKASTYNGRSSTYPSTNMQLRQLRYFIAVAEELHFHRAANRLCISQPPLTQQIRALEEELQVQLLVRNSRNVELTDAGKTFLERARNILASIDLAVVAAQGARDGSMGLLQVGYIHSASHTLMPLIVSACSRELPKLRLQLHELDVDRQVDALLTDRIDVGLIRLPTLHPGIGTRVLLSEPFMLALPKGHSLARGRVIDMRRLDGEPLIGYPDAHGEGTFQRALLQICADAGIVSNISQEASTVQTALGLVRAGVGIAIVPRSARALRLDGVVYRDFSALTPKVSMGVAWRVDRHSSLSESFVQIAVDTVQRAKI